jgi:DNA topoisomerase-1
MKSLADAPIVVYKGEGKGKLSFGAFIKWSGLFYQCEQKYNFDNLSQSDIEALIEDKPKKNIDKVLHNWERKKEFL